MAVDKGGLQYGIKTTGEFQRLEQFKKLVRDTRAEVAKLRRSARQGVQFKAVAKELATAAKETKKVETLQSKIARETGLVGKALKEQVRATKQLAAENTKINVEIRKGKLDREEDFRTARRVEGVTRARAFAERRVTQELSKRARREQIIQAARERNLELTLEEKRSLQIINSEERERLALKQRQERLSARTNEKEIRDKRIQLAIEEKIAAANERQAIRRGLEARGRAPSGDLLSDVKTGRTAAGAAKATKEVNSLQQAIQRLSNSKAIAQANRISFTFRRLFGILAAFAVAREAVRNFRLLIRSSVELNAQLEQATLGVASLFTAVGNVTDPFGGAVDASQRLVLAQQAAREQIQKLRVDALRTTATFETLLDTFQVAVAPGLIAGLDIDQIRSFTVSISQAAAAIGLQQNQLAEEIRSILSGTIQARTTRIAVALGITNDDIRNAREAGVLAEFLVDRFSAFDEAGKEAFNTFNGLINRVRDGFEIIIQQGTLEFFDDLKVSLRQLFELLVTQDPVTDLLQPNPQAVRIFESFAGGLKEASQALRESLGSLSFETLLGFATLLGDATSGFLSLGTAIGSGLIRALSDISGAITRIKDAFEGLDLSGFISTITRFLVLAVSLQLALSLIGAAIGALLSPFFIFFGITRSIINVFKAARTAAILFSGTLTLVRGAASAAAVNLRLLASGNIAAAASFKTITASIATGAATFAALSAAVAAVILAITQFSGITDFDLSNTKLFISIDAGIQKLLRLGKLVKETTVEVIADANIGLETARTNAEKEVKRLTQIERDLRERLAILIDFLDSGVTSVTGEGSFLLRAVGTEEDAKSVQDLLKSTKKEIDLTVAAIERIEKSGKLATAAERAAAAEKEAAEILSRQLANADSLGDAIKRELAQLPTEIIDSLSERFSTIGKELGKTISDSMDIQIEDTSVETQGLLQTFQQLSPNIARAASTLEDMGSVAEDLRESIEAAGDEIIATQSTLGVTGGLLNSVTISLEKNQRLRELGQQFAQEEQQAQLQIEQIRSRIASRENQINALSAERRADLDQIEQAFRGQYAIQTEIASLENKQALAKKIVARDEALQASSLEKSKNNLDEINRLLDQTRQRQADGAKAIQAIEDSYREQGIAITEIADLVAGRIQDEGLLLTIQQRLNDVVRERGRLEARVNSEIARRVQAASISNTFDLGRDSRQRQLDLDLERFDLENRFAERQSLEIRRNNLLLQQAQRRLDFVREDVQIQNDRLAALIQEQRVIEETARAKLAASQDEQATKDFTREIADTEAVIAQLLEEQNALRENGNLLIGEAKTEVDNLAQSVELLNRQQDQPLAFGLEQGFRDFANSVPSLFEEVVSQLQGTLNQFASTASQTVADIFDPRKNASITEAFGNFLLQIGQQILQAVLLQVIRQLILASGLFQAQTSQAGTSLLAAGTLWQSIAPVWLAIATQLRSAAIILAGTRAASGGLAAGGPVMGFDSGGTIPNRPASRRPRGLHHTDTVPIWAAPGEFMVRARSAFAYGHDVLDKINRGMVDPMALRALAGVSSVQRTISGKPKLGYAEGGPIVAPRTAGAASGGSGGTRVLPVLVADNAAVADLLRAGEGALIEAVERAGFVRG